MRQFVSSQALIHSAFILILVAVSFFDKTPGFMHSSFSKTNVCLRSNDQPQLKRDFESRNHNDRL